MSQTHKSSAQASPKSAHGSGKGKSPSVGAKLVVGEEGIATLLAILKKIGYKTIGPTLRDGAVVYEEIASLGDLPVGWSDEQDGGKYRLVQGTKGSFFEYLVGPTSWKRYLFPPNHKMWEADRKGGSFEVKNIDPTDIPSYAFIGVRSCELNAIRIQDKVFGFGRDDKPEAGIFSDPGYVERRKKSLIIAVNCSRAGKTCFCTSMGGDPHVVADQGHDLALTELISGSRHEFVVEVGSERGALIAELLSCRSASSSDLSDEEAVARKARSQMGRKMVANVKDVLKRNLNHKRWEEVASRCLSCANCTMVCPTCFCSSVEDKTDITGNHTERWRTWDSCFSIDFSYIHGGAVRRETKSRYRQWITHKLSNWHEQYGTSGCVGCGRCITWCPVGIDITEEAKAIKDTGE
ncbi:MAG: 4Fe-4S dicluster domain-containing protein [Alphaproteobacteria bacterium]|nr:4Fe-4S dicluster domain-containing protein [Alphaproteobacteria bacterium]